MKVMYKPYTSDFIDPAKGSDDAVVNPVKAELEKTQAEYLKAEVAGTLVFRVSNGRNLVSFSGSTKSVIVPKVKITVGNSPPAVSAPANGTNPDWNYTGKVATKHTIKEDPPVAITIESENNFMGHKLIPLSTLEKREGTWVLNGYYDLVDKNENRKAGEKLTGQGRIYVQMMWTRDEVAELSPSAFPKFNTVTDKTAK